MSALWNCTPTFRCKRQDEQCITRPDSTPRLPGAKWWNRDYRVAGIDERQRFADVGRKLQGARPFQNSASSVKRRIHILERERIRYQRFTVSGRYSVRPQTDHTAHSIVARDPQAPAFVGDVRAAVNVKGTKFAAQSARNMRVNRPRVTIAVFAIRFNPRHFTCHYLPFPKKARDRHYDGRYAYQDCYQVRDCIPFAETRQQARRPHIPPSGYAK